MMSTMFARAPALLLLASAAAALDAAQWKQRTIYQVLTDRFALAPGKSDTCSQGGCPYGNYCGGTYDGIASKFDYIKGMGFDAVWISPVVDNTDCGYHGYWAQQQFEIEEHFGGADELTRFMKTAKQQGIAVMLDIVGNHMGPPKDDSYSEMSPFNSPDHYHGTLSSHCAAGGTDENKLETCWLANLADLKQENPYVTQQLLAWMQGLQDKYNFDGIRIDTVPYVNKQFWHALKTQPLNNTYAVGEVLVQNQALDYLAGYQHSNGDEGVNGPLLDGILNYPLFNALRNTFQRGQGMDQLKQTVQAISSAFADAGALGTFAENHDQPRWLLGNGDWTLYRNGLTCVMMLPGVPIAYYGTEQGMAGGQSDNDKRQPLWSHGGYDTTAPLYQWTSRLVKARKAMLSSLTDADIDVISHFGTPNNDDRVLSFMRGPALTVVTNIGSGKGDISAQISTSWKTGLRVCDVLQSSSVPVLHANVSACEPQGSRSDCGHMGTNQQKCEAGGCCWGPVTPNPGNLPWCFHKSGPSPPPPPPSPPTPPGARCATVGNGGTLSVTLRGGEPSVFLPSPARFGRW